MKTNHQRRFTAGTHANKSMQSWLNVSKLADRRIVASIPNDFCNGHRGMARSAAGAKKFVRSRTRFHENAALRRFVRDGLPYEG